MVHLTRRCEHDEYRGNGKAICKEEVLGCMIDGRGDISINIGEVKKGRATSALHYTVLPGPSLPTKINHTKWKMGHCNHPKRFLRTSPWIDSQPRITSECNRQPMYLRRTNAIVTLNPNNFHYFTCLQLSNGLHFRNDRY